jgi:lipoteichoic acid synthase
VTPFLDEFFQESIVYDQVYTTVSHTSKALVGILCGMYPILRMEPYESGPNQLPLVCLPHILKPQGYRTAFMRQLRSLNTGWD